MSVKYFSPCHRERMRGDPVIWPYYSLDCHGRFIPM